MVYWQHAARQRLGATVKLTDLRGILQYIPQFREKTFILAVDGGIVTDENFANILLDVAVLRSLNIRVVLVHGAAEQIKALAEKQGVHASNLDGTGVTDAATLQLAIEAANRLTHEILKVFPPTTSAPPARMPSLRIRWGSSMASTNCLPGRSSVSTRNFFKLC